MLKQRKSIVNTVIKLLFKSMKYCRIISVKRKNTVSIKWILTILYKENLGVKLVFLYEYIGLFNLLLYLCLRFLQIEKLLLDKVNVKI